VKPSRAGKKAARGAVFTVRTSTAEETQAIGRALGRVLRRAVLQDGIAAVVALEGPLGSGKTCFVQGLARGLGAAGNVRSPTFTLIQEHPGDVPLHHVDLYRLGAAEADALGLEEVTDQAGVTAIEWPGRAADILPAEHLTIELQFDEGPSQRRLGIIPAGARYERLVAALRRCASSP
jgi:tRNA threonylcarbamoyladenosine biosynthesis protein TsaE